MKCLVAASATAVVFFVAWPAAATPLEDAMSACRRNTDLNMKVAACTYVIERSHDRRALLRAYNTRGLALCDLDRCAEAVSDFDRVVDIEPSIAGYFDNRARALRAAKRFPEAIADSERAMRMAPTYAFTYMGKAYTLDEAGRYEQALVAVDQALAIEPSNAGNWAFRGRMLAKLARWDEAYAAFERALSLDPSHVSVYVARAETEEAQGRLDDALRDYERYPKDGTDAEKVARAMEALRSKIRDRDAIPREDANKTKIETLEAEKRQAIERIVIAERSAEAERRRADKERADAQSEKRRADAEKSRADDQQRRAEKERLRADKAEEVLRRDKNITTPDPDRPVAMEEADRLNASVLDLDGQVAALRDVLREQKQASAAAASVPDAQTIGVTAALVSKQLAERQAELDEKQKRLETYLEMHPAERDRLSKVPRPGRAYPRVSYATPLTRAAGELWVEPMLDESGAMLYRVRAVSPLARQDAAQETIAVSPTELADVQAALTKIRAWSLKASEAGIRRNYSKRAACFPQTDCPDEGSAIEGRPYTELRFIIRDDGTTMARLQRSTGQTTIGYDLSSDSGLLLCAYIAYATAIAGREFKSLPKQDLDKLFK